MYIFEFYLDCYGQLTHSFNAAAALRVFTREEVSRLNEWAIGIEKRKNQGGRDLVTNTNFINHDPEEVFDNLFAADSTMTKEQLKSLKPILYDYFIKGVEVARWAKITAIKDDAN